MPCSKTDFLSLFSDERSNFKNVVGKYECETKKKEHLKKDHKLEKLRENFNDYNLSRKNYSSKVQNQLLE